MVIWSNTIAASVVGDFWNAYEAFGVNVSKSTRVGRLAISLGRIVSEEHAFEPSRIVLADR